VADFTPVSSAVHLKSATVKNLLKSVKVRCLSYYKTSAWMFFFDSQCMMLTMTLS